MALFRGMSTKLLSLKSWQRSPSGLTEKNSNIQCHSVAYPRLKKKGLYKYPDNSYLFIFGNSIVLCEQKSNQWESLHTRNEDTCSLRNREIFNFSYHIFIFLLLIYFKQAPFRLRSLKGRGLLPPLLCSMNRSCSPGRFFQMPTTLLFTYIKGLRKKIV